MPALPQLQSRLPSYGPSKAETLRNTSHVHAVEDVVVQSDADRFKGRAEECRRLAEECVSAQDKEAWLRLAGEWDKLAQSAVQRQGIFERYE